MKTIRIEQDIYDYIESKTVQSGEAPALVLRRELHLPQPTQTIEIDDETYLYLVSKALALGESASDILRRELHLRSTPPPPQASVIEFHIPAGTGNQPWNAPESPVVATVGDTLRFVNDDTVPHQLHASTPGGPFPHWSQPLFPGQAVELMLQTPYDPSSGDPVYEHTVGPTARFYVRVRPAQ